MVVSSETMSLPEAMRFAARLGVPLVHFGQTVFWDEPTKALLLPAMREAGVAIPLIAGVHDTDYFSKLPAGSGVEGPAAVLPANDGSTRSLWAAAGECAIPFGGETRVSLRALARHGVPVHSLAKAHAQGRQAFIDEYTEAFGWRGLAWVAGDDVTARDVLTGDVAPYLRELAAWGLHHGLSLIADEPTRAVAERYASRMLRRLDLALARHAAEPITQCFKTILRHMMAQLAGMSPDHLRVTSSSEFYLFNVDTARQPRFGPLDLFLDPATRSAACAAYDESVEHTGTYVLRAFGDGALPFDLVVPGRGRGTIRCTPCEVLVDLAGTALTLGSSRGLESREVLARLVERRFGKGCALVGKAIVLPMMFLSEAVMVLADGGSAYLATSTARLVDGLLARGMRLRLYPVLRLRYHALDALDALDTVFALPPHLAAGFGRGSVPAGEFAREWRSVVARHGDLLSELSKSHGAGVVLREAAAESADAAERLRRYGCIRCRMRQHGEDLRGLSASLRAKAAEAEALRARRLDLEARSGLVRRETIVPLWRALERGPDGPTTERVTAQAAEAEELRSAIREEIGAIRAESARVEGEWRELRTELRRQQSHGVPAFVHAEMHAIEEQAGWDRLRLVRRALMIRGLDLASRRPTAWWFPFLGGGSSGGPWYAEVARRCEAWFEHLTESIPPEGPEDALA